MGPVAVGGIGLRDAVFDERDVRSSGITDAAQVTERGHERGAIRPIQADLRGDVEMGIERTPPGLADSLGHALPELVTPIRHDHRRAFRRKQRGYALSDSPSRSRYQCDLLIETPHGRAERVLGGSACYASLAARLLSYTASAVR